MNASLSAVEAFLPSKRQCDALDGAVAALARIAMRGRACTWKEHGEVRSLTNVEVLAHWKIARAEVELRVRRLRWLQQAAADRNNNVQLFAAIFGTISGQAFSTLGDDDSISASANPWAKRVQAAVDELIHVSEEAQALKEEAGPHVVAWLKHPEWRS
eukprot:3389479-Pyramimonas_sp.AAC.1